MRKAKKILLIDDNKIDLFVSQRIIELFDPSILVKSFTSASTAIFFLRIGNANEIIKSPFIPDLIFVDINMPEMDGFQFLNEFQKLEVAKAQPINIYMLTSSAYIEDIKRANNHGLCTGYLSKPLSKSSLENILKLNILL